MKKLFWGLLFLLGAAYVVVDQLGYLTVNIETNYIIFTIFLIPIFITSLLKRNFFFAAFSAAALLIIYKTPLNLEALTNDTILITALLTSIGLSIIFGGRNRCYKSNKSSCETIINSDDSEEVNLNVSFGSSIKYVNTNDFKIANIKSSFSGVKVYFDNAKIKEDNAIINLDVSFSGVELYIPKEWKIINNVNTSLGAVEQKNEGSPKTDKTITLEGRVNLGGVEIICI